MRTERIHFRHELPWLAVCALVGCDGPVTYHAPPPDRAKQAATRPNRPQADSVRLNDVEWAVFDGLNRLRRKHGLAALVLRADLVAMARRHSRDMMTRKSLTHTGSDGSKPTGRADRAGVRYRAIAENVASNFGHADPGAKALDGWSKSPRHRRNMLDARFEETGIGAVRCPKTGTWYFTNVLCLRRTD